MLPANVLPAFTRDAALVMLGALTLDDLARVYALTTADSLSQMELHAAEIERRAIAARVDGTAVEVKAALLLDRLVDEVRSVVDAGDIAPATALKAIELMHKVAGVSEKRAERHRQRAGAENSLPQIVIILGNAEEPALTATACFDTIDADKEVCDDFYSPSVYES